MSSSYPKLIQHFIINLYDLILLSDQERRLGGEVKPIYRQNKTALNYPQTEVGNLVFNLNLCTLKQD
ncbi:hypothetical protein [Planktothrix serta]|uniref:hypothetical protein n=1 Tax=Planktothrix serta TaxID=1678310 RepID=UPI0009F94E6F|nr:hypothetical protein [Planktothrix serta]